MVRMRFFLSLMVMLFLWIGYGYLKEKIIQLHRLSQSEQTLSLDLQNKRRVISAKQLPKNKISSIENSYEWISLKNPDILLDMIRLSEKSGFMIQTLQPLAIQAVANMTILPVNLVLVGDIRQLVTWLNNLKLNHLNVGISDFALNVDEHQMTTIEMTLYVLGVHSMSLSLADKNALSIRRNDLMQTTSIDQLKLVGYLHNQHGWIALIKLPNGETHAIPVGAVIGDKKARVVNITENEVMLMVGQKPSYLYFT